MSRFFVGELWASWCGAPSLGRGWFCNLLMQLLLGLTRAITHGSKSCRTHDYILLSHMKLPRFISPGNIPFHRLLWLTGLQWGYSKPPPFLSTEHIHKQLLLTQPRWVCTLRWHVIHWVVVQYKSNSLLQQYSTLLHTSLYILHTSLVGGMFSERTCTLLFLYSIIKYELPFIVLLFLLPNPTRLECIWYFLMFLTSFHKFWTFRVLDFIDIIISNKSYLMILRVYVSTFWKLLWIFGLPSHIYKPWIYVVVNGLQRVSHIQGVPGGMCQTSGGCSLW
jgi:hypothetical protein